MRSDGTSPWPMQLIITQFLLLHNPSTLQLKLYWQNVPVFFHLAASMHPDLLCLHQFAGQFASLV